MRVISFVVWLLVVMLIALSVNNDYFASVAGCFDVWFWLLCCGFWLRWYVGLALMCVVFLCYGWVALWFG